MNSYNILMRTVGIENLKLRLSEYVRFAADGETVLITDRDQVVAELRAPEVGRQHPMTDATKIEWTRKGWLRPGQIHQPFPPCPETPRIPLAELLKEIELMRSEK